MVLRKKYHFSISILNAPYKACVIYQVRQSGGRDKLISYERPSTIKNRIKTGFSSRNPPQSVRVLPADSYTNCRQSPVRMTQRRQCPEAPTPGNESICTVSWKADPSLEYETRTLIFRFTWRRKKDSDRSFMWDRKSGSINNNTFDESENSERWIHKYVIFREGLPCNCLSTVSKEDWNFPS